MMRAEIGLIGLGVMGHMLARNIERNGYRVAGYDLDKKKVEDFNTQNQGKNLFGFSALKEFLESLNRPLKIIMMVPAGQPVDSVIADIRKQLTRGDLLIDGGNTYFLDTERRSRELEPDGIIYIGTGISGGEQGALWGPSIMPGGQMEGWQQIQTMFEAISAKVDNEPCVAYMGRGGAGHYVKMVHNGIEYGDMQLISEAYDLLHSGLGLGNDQLHDVFDAWNETELESYLIKISAAIFVKKDPESGRAVIDLILDEAQQKGTGKWASQNAMDLGSPIPTINAAVESRMLSFLKDERILASKILQGPRSLISGGKDELISCIKDALYAAKICSYAQGFSLLQQADREYKFNLNLGEIARIWRGGCIIRAQFLNHIREAFERSPGLTNILLDGEFANAMNQRQAALREVVGLAARAGIPVLAFSSALAYFDAYRSERLPANLVQAQRDYFGAHTYHRIDREGVFHTQWTNEEM
jgi:6-phosphogluconate dehydrogenase